MTAGFCGDCGQRLNTGTAFCGACGTPIVAQAEPPPPPTEIPRPAEAAPRHRGPRRPAHAAPTLRADAVLDRGAVLALAASMLWLAGLGAVTGIVLGRASLQRIRASDGAVSGKGYAIAAVAVGAGALVAMLAATVWVIAQP